jgi:hypothetical protein
MSPLVKRYTSDFPIPDEGLHEAELLAVRDLGLVKGYDGVLKPKVKLIWRLGSTGATGRPLQVHQTLNSSLHPQSALSKVIADILGKAPDPGADFELNALIGAKVELLIKHNRSEATGRVFANVAQILRHASSVPARSQPPPEAGKVEIITDEDIPF